MDELWHALDHDKFYIFRTVDRQARRSPSAACWARYIQRARDKRVRDFLTLVTGATAVVGTAAATWALLDSMNPSADVIAARALMDIDVSKLAADRQVIVRWRDSPMLTGNRTSVALEPLREPSLIARLADPDSDVQQQPPCARNWHRSIKPEIAVLVSICTHPGCLPRIYAATGSTDTGAKLAGWLFLSVSRSRVEIRSGGSRLLGRTWAYQQPFNPPVPSYHFVNILPSENPPWARRSSSRRSFKCSRGDRLRVEDSRI